MSEAQPKQLKDYSDEVKLRIPEYTAHITTNSTEAQVSDAIANLLNLEKKTRLAADARSTSEVALAILRLTVTTKQWRMLNDHITMLSKRRAQLQKVQENMITYGATIVEQTTDPTIKRQLIETLRTVSDGKMFAELERARLTKILANMEEKDGKVNEAAELLQEVQVETIGSMETREKAEFLCEQVRLCLAKRDYVRAEIIAKKVDEKLLNDEQYQDLKVRYYKLKIQYHTHYGNYLEIFNAWRHIYNTTSVQADPSQWQPALRRVIIYLILSPWVPESPPRQLLPWKNGVSDRHTKAARDRRR